MPRVPMLSRREMLTLAAAGALAAPTCGWAEPLAQAAANSPGRKRACILLWMNGGPSQLETFDPKPNHANGGPFRAINTRVPGIQFSELLPKLANHSDRMSIIRSMSTREGDHTRGSYYLRTGYLPQGPIQHPTLGSLAAKELGAADSPLPSFVSIAPYRQFSPQAYAPGFLGPSYAPLLVADSTNFQVRQPNQPDDYDDRLKVQDLQASAELAAAQVDARLDMLQEMEREFVARHPGLPGQSHLAAYDRAIRLMRTNARHAFDLEQETTHTRDSYGRSLFGQGCLLARRLVERGVPFVEVTLGGFQNNALGWDTHFQGFPTTQRLCEAMDQGWSALMADLRQRGMLDDVLIVWMGEFGRTPRINQQAGRDHFPNAWSAVLAGAGVKGGMTHGQTTADGMAVHGGNGVSVPDFIATICRALRIDPEKQNMSNVGRPIRIADVGARPIQEVLA